LQNVAGVAWDSEKDRLVILLQGDHPLSGHALLYATVQEPLVSAICLGPIHLPQWDASNADGQDQPLCGSAVAMQTSSRRGALAAFRCRTGTVAVVPLGLRYGPMIGGPLQGRSAASGMQSGTFF
jgi:hypothetical protein